ncbi:MAG: hypothetical protein HC906_18365, partial [Bacteroidales bacterium]|nr:hypothetical protein [Bacteroidales bacterium]
MKYLLSILSVFYTLATYNQTANDLYLQGVAKMLNNQPDSAIIILTSAIESDPSQVNFYVKRGEAFLNTRQFERAVHDFEKVNNLKDKSAELWLAKTYSLSGNENKAIEHLQNHLNSKYRLPEKELKSDDAFDVIQDSDGWFDLWQKEWYSEEEKIKDDVDYLVNRENYLEALELVDSKIKESKNKETLYRYRAQVFSKQGNPKAAAMDWSLVLQKDRNPEFYKERGLNYLKAENYALAISDFTQVLRQVSAD